MVSHLGPGGRLRPEHGEILDIHRMPERFRRAIAGFEYEERYRPGYSPRDLEREEAKFADDGQEMPEAFRAKFQPIGRTVKLKFPDRNAAAKNAIDVLGLKKAEKLEVDTGPNLLEILNRSLEVAPEPDPGTKK